MAQVFILMSLAGVALTSMASIVKLMGHTLPTGEIIFLRSLAHLLLVAPFIFKDTRTLTLRKLALLAPRAFYGAIGVACFFGSLQALNSPTATVLTWTSPFFVILISMVKSKSRIGPEQWPGLLILFLGLLLLFVKVGDGQRLLFIGMALVGAFFSGLGYTSLAHSAKVFSPHLIAAAFSFVLLFSSAAFSLEQFVTLTPGTLVFVFFLGLCVLVYQYCVAQAYKIAPAQKVAPWAMLTPIISLSSEICLNQKKMLSLEGLAVLIMILGLVCIEFARSWIISTARAKLRSGR